MTGSEMLFTIEDNPDLRIQWNQNMHVMTIYMAVVEFAHILWKQ